LEVTHDRRVHNIVSHRTGYEQKQSTTSDRYRTYPYNHELLISLVAGRGVTLAAGPGRTSDLIGLRATLAAGTKNNENRDLLNAIAVLRNGNRS
jgi:hypothetical protein